MPKKECSVTVVRVKNEALEAYRNSIEFGEDEERINKKINSISQ